MNIEQVTLKNGLNTLFIDSRGSTLASIQIWFRAGSALEGKDNQGIAHFLEHMFFKGTKKRPGSAIAHEVESYGGEINAFTSFDYTCYYINAPVTQINKTVEILLDMVSNPLFLQTELIPEREVVFEEFRRATDNPSQYNFKEIQKTCFTGTYSHQILGTEKTIKNFSRKQLIDFRSKFYNLSNAMLIVAGDLKERTKIESTINSFKLPKGPKSSFPEFKLKKTTSISSHHKDVRQACLTLNFEAPKYLTEKSSKEELALNSLAYGEMSPLYKNLVTKTSLATSVSGSTMYFCDGGIHFLRIVFPEKNFKKVLDETKKTIKEVFKNKFRENDLSRIKNQYVASKVYERESLESFAFSMGHSFAQDGDIHTDNKYLTQIKEVTLNDINNSIQELFTKTPHITLQLPKNEKLEEYNKELKVFSENLKSLSSLKKQDKKENYKVSKFDPEVKIIKLNDGIDLIYRHNPIAPTFVFHSYIKGGQSFEADTNAGIFQLISRLITNGYEGMNFDDLKIDLENKSAYLNGFSGKNAYGLTLHGQSEHKKSLFEHFFKTLLTPTFPEDYLKLEKELIYRTFENQKEDPVKQCFKLVNKMMFHNHPYSLDLLGTKESIEKITRIDLEKLHQKHLRESKIIFTYSGSDDLSTVLDEIKKYASSFQSRKDLVAINSKIIVKEGESKSLEFKREQTHIFIGRPSYKLGDKKDLYIKMLNAYLSGQSSELFVEVRDRQGLCYSVSPIQHTALEASFWGIYIGAGKEKAEASKKAIISILDKLQKKGLTKSEFERIKKMIEGQTLLNIQTNDDYANFYSVSYLQGFGIDFQHENFKTMNKFTHTEFNKFLNSFLNYKWNIIEVGPRL